LTHNNLLSSSLLASSSRLRYNDDHNVWNGGAFPSSLNTPTSNNVVSSASEPHTKAVFNNMWTMNTAAPNIALPFLVTVTSAPSASSCHVSVDSPTSLIAARSESFVSIQPSNEMSSSASRPAPSPGLFSSSWSYGVTKDTPSTWYPSKSLQSSAVPSRMNPSQSSNKSAVSPKAVEDVYVAHQKELPSGSTSASPRRMPSMPPSTTSSSLTYQQQLQQLQILQQQLQQQLHLQQQQQQLRDSSSVTPAAASAANSSLPPLITAASLASGGHLGPITSPPSRERSLPHSYLHPSQAPSMSSLPQAQLSSHSFVPNWGTVPSTTFTSSVGPNAALTTPLVSSLPTASSPLNLTFTLNMGMPTQSLNMNVNAVSMAPGLHSLPSDTR
jgi:hypothetical protein